jgi:glycosyltransferase involved in cell wall biosynthesis
VTQFAPPSSFTAARRTAGLTRYLARLGHSVTLLTSTASGEGEVEGAEQVVRARDLVVSPLNWRRRAFDAQNGVGDVVYGPPSRLASVVVPDLALGTWFPFALARSLRLAKRRHFDCVITSSPPQSTHLVGAALRRRGLAWIAEFRDGWTFDPPREPWPLESQRRFDASLEARVLEKADALVAVTAPIRDDLARRSSGRVALITNGFDPEDAIGVGAEDTLLDPQRHSIVHTGRMGVSGRDPRPLFEALRRLNDAGGGAAPELVLAGPLSRGEVALLEDPAFLGLVRSVGVLDGPRVRRLQRSASTLLVLAEGASSRSVATGKLFEYLAAGRPILVLGEDTEAARIVSETRTGFAASATDPEEIANALARLRTQPVLTADADAVGAYSYDRLASAYSQLIDDVCG